MARKELQSCAECHKWFENKMLREAKIEFDYENPENNSCYIFKLCSKCWILCEKSIIKVVESQRDHEGH